MRVLVHRIGQEAALVVADIARRRADQSADGVTLHVLGHVKALHLDAEGGGQLLGHLRLADAGRTREQERADRLVRIAQTGARQLHRRRDLLDRLLLAKHHAVQVGLQLLQAFGVGLGHRLGRNARHLGDDGLDLLLADDLFPLGFDHQHLRGAGLVDDVDRLVRQLAVGHVAGRKLHRRADRAVGVAHLVVLLVVGLQPLQDLDRVLDRRLVDVDFLEAPHQGAVLFEVLAILLVGGRAHAAQRTRRQRRLQQVGGVHGPAAGRACADHRVDLVNEEHGVVVVLQLLDHLLQPLLEVAAIAGAGQQRAHVQRVDGGVLEDVRHLAVDDLAGQAFGDGGLADARVADQQRVVLGAAAQDLDRAVDFGLTTDQRIDLALAGLLVEVDAVGLQRLAARLGGGRILGLLGRRALGRLGLRCARLLGDAVGDVVDRVIPRHVLLLQEIGGVAFPLGEDGDQHVCAGHLFAAGRLDVDHRALDHALEASGRLGVLAGRGGQRRQIIVDIQRQRRLQRGEIDVAGAHDAGRVRIVDQRQEQVFKGCVLMTALVGVADGAVQGFFERTRKRGHGEVPLSPFPSCIAADAGDVSPSPPPGRPWFRPLRR